MSVTAIATVTAFFYYVICSKMSSHVFPSEVNDEFGVPMFVCYLEVAMIFIEV